MPIDIRLVRAHEFVRVTPTGELDFETSKKAIIEIGSTTAHLVDYVILLDTRQVKVQMSVADLWYLAAEFRNLRETKPSKTAVLCPIENFDNADFFALCSENRGFRVKAFTSFEDAIDWLIGMTPDI